MAKYPTVGEVKTRIGKSIGYFEATKLYKYFLMDIVENIKHLNIPFFIYYSPKEREEDFKVLLGEDLKYVPQIGEGLGERLYNGFKISSKEYSSAIAVASDVPDLPASLLEEAVNKLDDHRIVIGPSRDGGYYLIGLQDNAITWDLFSGIHWSTESVYEETLNVIGKDDISLYSLEIWDDVDHVSDLSRLVNSKNPNFERSNTWKYLISTNIV